MQKPRKLRAVLFSKLLSKSSFSPWTLSLILKCVGYGRSALLSIVSPFSLPELTVFSTEKKLKEPLRAVACAEYSSAINSWEHMTNSRMGRARRAERT